MGAAEADGDVETADPEATIDGAEPRQEPARSLPVEVLAVVRDYPELLEVERRHYVVVRELARGGMGRVLEARDLRLGRQVAIKELLPKNRDIARRFEREARITARLQHPSIIHVYEAGNWQGGEPFYAMPMVPGRSLDKLVAEKTTLAERIALLPRVIAVADALAYAHDKNVIHRDLKPANVLVGDFGETVVIDWGLAKDLSAQGDPKESMKLSLRATGEETVSGSVVGTPAYMPPEQARGEAVDQRADVYSLGALLYKVLAGHAPYQGKNANEVIEQVKAAPPTPLGEREPETPPDLLTIVSKAMARNPAHRYATAAELAKDLERFQTGQLVGAHHYTAGELVRRWLRRHRIAVGVAVVATAALAIGGVISVRRVVEARDRAQAQRVKLLMERGRSELIAGHDGAALAYLVAAAQGGYDAALGFALAEARRPFDAGKVLTAGHGPVAVATSPDGAHVVTAGDGDVELWTSDGSSHRMLGSVKKPSIATFDLTSTRVAVATEDGTVVVWKLDGTLITRLAAHTGAILDLTFSIDGRLATAGADGFARVWDLTTGKSIEAQCTEADDTRAGRTTRRPAILSVRFDELGLLAAYGAEDGSACVWQTFKQGVEITPLRGHLGAVTAVRWSPDGSWIATASADGSARIWSPYYGKAIVKTMQHEQPIAALEVSPDGSRIVTADAGGEADIWTVPANLPSGDDGTIVAEHADPHRLARHGGRIVTVAFSADGELVATGGEDWQASVVEAHTGQTYAAFEHADAVRWVAFAAGGHALVTGSRDGTSHLWDVDRVKPHVYTIDWPVEGLAVSSRGVVAATRQDSGVELVEPARDLPSGLHYGVVRAAAFTPDGSTLVTGGEDKYLVAWDVAGSAQPVKLENAAGNIVAMAASPDGDHVATAGAEAQLWSLKSRTATPLPSNGASVRALAYSPSGDLLVGATSRGLLLWNRAGQLLGSRDVRMPVTALAFSKDGRKLAIGGVAAARVLAVDGTTIDPAPLTMIEGVRGEVRGTVFACRGLCLVTAGELGTVDVWDATTGKSLQSHDVHAGPVTGLGLSPDGKKVWISTLGKADPKDPAPSTVTDWNVEVETANPADLEKFMKKQVPWELGSDDVVHRLEGGSNDQRGSDGK